jgi:hypothetical protein
MFIGILGQLGGGGDYEEKDFDSLLSCIIGIIKQWV